MASVTKKVGTKTTTIVYTYDGTGNRVYKEVKVIDGTVQIKTAYTAYWRDAQGNVLQTHNRTSSRDINFVLTETQSREFVIYGSSRLGTYSLDQNVYTNGFNGIANYSLTLGYKQYELSNHLGNVLTTITDNWLLNTDVRVLSSQDYYPFGMAIPPLSVSSLTSTLCTSNVN